MPTSATGTWTEICGRGHRAPELIAGRARRGRRRTRGFTLVEILVVVVIVAIVASVAVLSVNALGRDTEIAEETRRLYGLIGMVREQAGVRKAVVVEAVPDADLPDPAPKLTTKQAAVLEYLRQRGEPVEQRELAHQTHCGLAVIDALVGKGLARKSTVRIERLPNGLRELASRERQRAEEFQPSDSQPPVADAPGSPDRMPLPLVSTE